MWQCFSAFKALNTCSGLSGKKSGGENVPWTRHTVTTETSRKRQQGRSHNYCYSSCCCYSRSWWDDLFKKPKAPSFWNRIGMKFAHVRQVSTHRLTSRIFDLTSHFQDGCHDVILRNKVLPPGEWTRSVCRRLCSSVRQFLIYNTSLLVIT